MWERELSLLAMREPCRRVALRGGMNHNRASPDRFMPLAPGTRLGPYDVQSAIGAGGMGEVWRAHDRKLGRDVALKILPEHSPHDPDRLARFEREARVLASLNHPHIAAIYGLEEADGVRALVLELVEGPTLADRIARGPIPLDEALAIARQIARGARGRARSRHHPSRSEAGEHQAPRRTAR